MSVLSLQNVKNDTDNGGRGTCSAFGTCFLLLHPGITDQEHPKKHAVEKKVENKLDKHFLHMVNIYFE